MHEKRFLCLHEVSGKGLMFKKHAVIFNISNGIDVDELKLGKISFYWKFQVFDQTDEMFTG